MCLHQTSDFVDDELSKVFSYQWKVDNELEKQSWVVRSVVDLIPACLKALIPSETM